MSDNISSSVLQKAIAIQAHARDLIAQRDAGQVSTPAFQSRMLDWVSERRALFSSPVETPLDGLVLSHAIQQCASAIPTCVETEDFGSLKVAVDELLAASRGFLSYFEQESGTRRDTLGLHDDYTGPTRN